MGRCRAKRSGEESATPRWPSFRKRTFPRRHPCGWSASPRPDGKVFERRQAGEGRASILAFRSIAGRRSARPLWRLGQHFANALRSASEWTLSETGATPLGWRAGRGPIRRDASGNLLSHDLVGKVVHEVLAEPPVHPTPPAGVERQGVPQKVVRRAWAVRRRGVSGLAHVTALDPQRRAKERRSVMPSSCLAAGGRGARPRLPVVEG